MAEVKVYGANWCHDTQRSLKQLTDLGVQYQYHDVDADSQAADWVKEKNGGKQKLPTIQVGGQVLSVPSNAELGDALRESGVKQ